MALGDMHSLKVNNNKLFFLQKKSDKNLQISQQISAQIKETSNYSLT